jgi:energy-coupling factor transporter ATP-binding protein EcfA2
MKSVSPAAPRQFDVFLDQNGRACVRVQSDRESDGKGKGNPSVLAVGSQLMNALIRKQARESGQILKQSALDNINEELRQDAEEVGRSYETYNRVAPIEGGVEIDIGDEAHTRVRIAHGNVRLITSGSEVLFRRYRHSMQMVMPVPPGQGDFQLIDKYIANLPADSRMLLKAWMTYTLARPKVPTSKFVILQLLGGQGSGKSMLTKLIKRILDPAVTAVQTMPTNEKDLAIAVQQSHVLCFDNLRDIRKTMSDRLCTVATGGSQTGRQLFTNDEQNVIELHGALVLNGIHPFVTESDLAQRCLPLSLRPIPAYCRRSEAVVEQNLSADLPFIQGGLFDEIAKIQMQLSNVELTSPERMIDFCQWLAAMEIVDGESHGKYQACYSDILNAGQREALMENVLGAALVEFGDDLGDEGWSGTPTQLLQQLTFNQEGIRTRSRSWPDNPTALSKRIVGLQAALQTQGIHVELHRGKERAIRIAKAGSK